jgi:hypothetical protein
LIRRHAFTSQIDGVLEELIGDAGKDIFEKSPLIQYLNLKTTSATKGSKARGSFANLYALYVLAEDYTKRGFVKEGNYSEYAGARFSDLFTRQRELPFGSKLQNHALNHRLNEEFKRFFPAVQQPPIIRDPESNRYWINQNLLLVRVADKQFNLAPAILAIIDKYVARKRSAFDEFLIDCERLRQVGVGDPKAAMDFVGALLRPEVDARIFEIVSFAILKPHFARRAIFWGWSREGIHEDRLLLFKTGRTNANDGGIDFVMRPLGRFFQVTETVDFRKYFLDIEKVQRYPITFVIKSEAPVDDLLSDIRENATELYGIAGIVKRYMDAIEEVINIPILTDILSKVLDAGDLQAVIDELVVQSRLEFNIAEEPQIEDTTSSAT